MPLELTALLTAIRAIRSIVQDGKSAVESIKSGFGGKNDAAKEKLKQSLAALEERLHKVGELAEAVETYFETDESIKRLLALCQRAGEFVSENMASAEEWRNSDYEHTWKVLEMLFGDIDQQREIPRKVLLDRAEWYTERDKTQIEGKLIEFSGAFERGQAYLNSKEPARLVAEIDAMTRPLKDADLALRSTAYDEILDALKGLQDVGPGPADAPTPAGR